MQVTLSPADARYLAEALFTAIAPKPDKASPTCVTVGDFVAILMSGKKNGTRDKLVRRFARLAAEAGAPVLAAVYCDEHAATIMLTAPADPDEMEMILRQAAAEAVGLPSFDDDAQPTLPDVRQAA